MEENRNISSQRTDKHRVITGKVKITDLHDFKGHPFKVEHDMKLFELSKSIEENGVLVPLIVRENPYGTGYEIISGHRRKAACEWAGVMEVPMVVMNLTDEEAVITMVDSNLQRENIKPSEKAFAYKVKLEAMKSQGKRNDLFVAQVGTKLKKDELEDGSPILRADERLAKEVGESRNQIARYIRLTKLIPKMLEQEKPNQREQIKIRADKLDAYFPEGYTPKQKTDLIEQLLKEWHENQVKQTRRTGR